MKTINSLAILAAIVLSSCAVADFDTSADFTQYRTYAWGESNVEVDNPVYDSDLINKRIQRAVEEELQKRGIVMSSTRPDFVVRYHTYTEDKVEGHGGYPYAPYRFYPYGFYPYGFHPFAFGWGYPYFMRPPQMREYKEGTLIIDFVDRRSDELIWRGSVSGNVDNIAGVRKQIEKGVKAIMKKYPVSPDEPLRIRDAQDVTA